MNTYKMKLAVFAVCGLMLISGISQAATIVAINDNTALFTIDFDFIAGKFGYQIPVGAMRGLMFEQKKDYVGYRIVSGATPVIVETKTNAVVLSKQKIENGMYQIAAGERASFTLVGLFEIPETASTENYLVELTTLPHFVGTNRVDVSDSRLKQFKTDEIRLNEVISTPFSVSLEAK